MGGSGQNQEQWVEMAGSEISSPHQDVISIQQNCPQRQQEAVSGGSEHPIAEVFKES